MNRTITRLAFAAAVSLSLVASQTARAVDVPSPPHVNLVATPASRLRLGMTAADVMRVLGEAASETDVSVGSSHLRKMEFSKPIPGRVVLSEGRVSHVTLDAVGVKPDTLPPFIRPAWLGLGRSAVRRALGIPAIAMHYTFFGIDVDQWIFHGPSGGDGSVFFRENRVIARQAGQEIPSELFRVELPLPDAEAEGPWQAARVGITTSDIEKLYGAPVYRVEYVFNGQPASHMIYRTGKEGTFTGFTLVDGVVTEFEDLGRMPDNPLFQGR
jgi:hypothetical protein